MVATQELKIKAEFTNEMLEQIRTVVREELQAMIQPPLLVDEMTSEEVTEQLKKWKPIIQPADVSTNDSSPEKRRTLLENGTITNLGKQTVSGVHLTEHGTALLKRYAEEAEHQMINAELVYGNKLYEGILYFVKDVEL